MRAVFQRFDELLEFGGEHDELLEFDKEHFECSWKFQREFRELRVFSYFTFWTFLLLGKEGYTGNPLEPHRRLHEKVSLTKDHFQRWLDLFHQTVDENFFGLVAEDAKNRAKLIVMTWQPKFE